VAAVPGTSDLAVVEKTGLVRVWHAGALRPEPLLDPTGQVAQSSEQGLLDGNTRVAELDTRSGALRTVLFVRQPFANHNGGALAFGPDGLLYVGMGDGGSEGDPQGDGQNPRSLLGKILRLGVAQPGAPPEIYAIGLRYPWPFAFDGATGDLWVADVGQNSSEEVDRLAAGANLGWNLMEGNGRATRGRRRPGRARAAAPSGRRRPPGAGSPCRGRSGPSRCR
jgi:glucose/arabinose dehydrogenase